ncbi:MAG: class B sortase [Clostridia bacterium]|nr:class B sortase [Clostridia bacterium]
MNEKKVLQIALIIIFSVIFLIAAVACVDLFISGWFNSDKYKTESETPNQTVSDVVSQENLPDNPIDFVALTQQNPDAYAWITIPGTKVDYPILQAYFEDDNFYLTHDINKQKNRAGAIYTQRINQKNFVDPNTVIYGHNMANGTMFRTLHQFKKKDFFDENRYFYIYTPGNKYTYEIFAAYRYDNRHILNSFDFSDEQVFEEYLNSISSYTVDANFRSGVQLDRDSRIVTLSTCYANSKKEYRYLVQGVLIEHEKTK